MGQEDPERRGEDRRKGERRSGSGDGYEGPDRRKGERRTDDRRK